jgi:riboflavin synthase
MFTGLIEALCAVEGFEPRGKGARLVLARPEFSADRRPWEPKMGESIAVSGCCLTLTELEEGGRPVFDLTAETLARTWFSSARPGVLVNLERSLTLSDRLGGHLVSGHVDGLGHLLARADVGDGGAVYTFEVSPGFERYLIEKGSVSIDGISLTVVTPKERHFDVALIPETLERTNLGPAEVGQAFHLEADAIGKWVERLVSPHG